MAELYKKGTRWHRKSDNRFATKAEVAAFTGGSSGGGSSGKKRTTSTSSATPNMLGTEVLKRVKVEDGWDIVDGILSGLQARAAAGAAPGGVQYEAYELYRRAHPDGTEDRRDSVQRELGIQLADILGLVAVQLGWTPERWAACMPVELARVGAGGVGSFVGDSGGAPSLADGFGGGDGGGVGETIGQVGGGIIGAYFGGPAGAALGAGLGEGLGRMAEGYFSGGAPSMSDAGMGAGPEFFDSAAVAAGAAP